MKKNAIVTIRLDVSDQVLVDEVIKRCKQHPWIRYESKSDMFRFALRFLCQLDDTSFYRIISNRGNPNPFEVKMKTE